MEELWVTQLCCSSVLDIKKRRWWQRGGGHAPDRMYCWGWSGKTGSSGFSPVQDKSIRTALENLNQPSSLARQSLKTSTNQMVPMASMNYIMQMCHCRIYIFTHHNSCTNKCNCYAIWGSTHEHDNYNF